MAELLEVNQLGKKPDISLPAKFILTDEGLSYFSGRNIPVRDLVTYAGRRKSGFFWPSFKAALAQKLVVNRLLGQIDIERPEFLTKREEVIDITKLLVYGILYKKFKPTLNEILFNSEIIEQIKKNSGKKNITPDFKFNPEIVAAFMEKNGETIRTLKELLLLDPYALIDADRDMNDREKADRKRIMQRFVEQVDDNMWFLLHFVSKSKGRFEIIEKVNSMLISYVRKTKIADYIGFMLMELIQNAEKAHFERLAKAKKLMGPEDKIDTLLKNRQQREKLYELAAKVGQLINLNYSFEGDVVSVGSRLRLQINLTNKGVIIEKARKDLSKKIKTETRESSLASFYQDNDPEKLGAGLGLYYLSYLEDACQEEKMKFEAIISSDDRREETSVRIVLYI